MEGPQNELGMTGSGDMVWMAILRGGWRLWQWIGNAVVRTKYPGILRWAEAEQTRGGQTKKGQVGQGESGPQCWCE